MRSVLRRSNDLVEANLAKLPQTTHLSPMTEITDRLSTALADRYKIESQLG